MIVMLRALAQHPAVPAISSCLLRCAATAVLPHDRSRGGCSARQ